MLAVEMRCRRRRHRSPRRFPLGRSFLLAGPLLLSVALTTTACAQSGGGGAALGEFKFDRNAGTGLDLPGRLREISGLAVTADGRVLGHDDEVGTIYEIDIRQGAVVKEFYLGPETVRADFEGIAVADDRVYLVTSDGIIYDSPEGHDRMQVPYSVYETGVGRQCEVEGLAVEPSARTLLLPCKQARVSALEDSVVIFRWSLDRRQIARPSRIAIPRRRLGVGITRDEFRPSAIERHPVTGTYFLLSARGPAIAEISPTGRVLAIRRLSKGAHRQPEGIAFLPGLLLVIADEGKDVGRVTIYRQSRPRH